MAGLTTAALAGYAVGTIPSADIVTRLARGSDADIRALGSGNPGATNVGLEIGARWGLVVMVLDITKGVAAGRLGRLLADDDNGLHVGCVAAVAGHCWPAWNGFHGGKGVATSVGQVLVSFPVYFPLDAVVAVATAASPRWKRRAFTTTMTAAASWVVASAVWAWRGWPNAWGPTPSRAMPVAAALSMAAIAVRFLQVNREDPLPFTDR